MAISAKTTLVLVAAALAVAPAAQAAEISAQPEGVRRGQVVQVEWLDASSAAPTVAVQHRHGLKWVTVARQGTAAVVVEGLGDGVWSARWQSTYDSPAGLYRVRVEGADYTLTSEEFQVRPCLCVVSNPLKSKWRDGRYRVFMTATYAATDARSFLSLPTVVRTGRPVVRVLRDGRRIGSVLLRYRNGKFRGRWSGPRGPEDSIVFQLVSLADAFGNG
jgi:hypothetical protein